MAKIRRRTSHPECIAEISKNLQRLDETAPLEQAVSASGLGEAILAVFRATKLLSPFEKVRLQDVLRGLTADEFIRAAAHFTLGEGKPALLQMERALKPHVQ